MKGPRPSLSLEAHNLATTRIEKNQSSTFGVLRTDLATASTSRIPPLDPRATKIVDKMNGQARRPRRTETDASGAAEELACCGGHRSMHTLHTLV